jgi:hypothetical protein
VYLRVRLLLAAGPWEHVLLAVAGGYVGLQIGKVNEDTAKWMRAEFEAAKVPAAPWNAAPVAAVVVAEAAPVSDSLIVEAEGAEPLADDDSEVADVVEVPLTEKEIEFRT